MATFSSSNSYVEQHLYHLGRIDNEINKIEEGIRPLNWLIRQIEDEEQERWREFRSCEKLVERLKTWLDMDSRGEFNANKISEELRAEIAELEKVLKEEYQHNRHDKKRDNHKRERQLSECQARETFVRQTFADIAKNEVKLRCIRAMIKLVE